MKKTFFILVICLITSLKSFSQDWQFVVRSYLGDGTTSCDIYMKPVEYDAKLGVKKAWVKHVIPKFFYDKDGVTHTILNGYTLNLVNVKCSERKILTSTVSYYDGENRYIHQESIPYSNNVFEEILPESLGDFLFGLICK